MNRESHPAESQRPSPDLAELFKDWKKDEIVRFAAFLLHNYRVMDAFWFLNLEKAYGMETACRFNEAVWAKVGSLAVRDIKKRFSITEGGLKGFLAVLKYYPWHLLTHYDVEEVPDELILSVPSCPSQEGRRRHGLGEYPCRAMHAGEFKAMAAEVDPRIRVECVFAPPDRHPAELWCKWRFTMGE